MKLAFSAASQYFGALAAKGNEAEQLVDEEGFQRLTSNIHVGLRGLQEARRRFIEHRSIDRLTIEAVTALEAILGSVASLSGFAVAEGAALTKDTTPATALANAGLWEWAVLFAKDLARHYERRYRWSSEKELLQLASHAERLLWTIGVVATPVEQGHWIDVYDDERLRLVNHVLSQ